MSEPTYTIRPLVWKRGPPPMSDCDLYKWHADTVVGWVSIMAGLYHSKETTTRRVCGLYGPDIQYINDAEAKAAAERLYRETLSTALEKVPQ